jgi:hypothetical protein
MKRGGRKDDTEFDERHSWFRGPGRGQLRSGSDADQVPPEPFTKDVEEPDPIR